jgi:hypothetical protein
MLSFIGSVIGATGSIFGGLFRTQRARTQALAESVRGVTDFLKSSNATDAQVASAVASVVSSEAHSESWMARSWRPIFMLSCIVIYFSWMFLGYTPLNANAQLPPFIQEVFDVLKIGLCGYIPARSVDKWVAAAYKTKLFNNILTTLTKGKIELDN